MTCASYNFSARARSDCRTFVPGLPILQVGLDGPDFGGGGLHVGGNLAVIKFRQDL